MVPPCRTGFSPSQVIEQREHFAREGDHPRRDGGEEGPVEERDAQRALVQPPAHVRPEIALQFGVGAELLQSFVRIHSSFVLRMRTARNTRDFTPFTEMPRPRAISS